MEMPYDMTALELSKLLKSRKIGVAETVRLCLSAAKRNKHNAFLAVDEENALKRADAVQKRLDAGEALSPLAGVPIGVKDNISTKGIETTCASAMLGGYTPVFNATVIDKLEQADMIVVGKLNMDEFAMGGSSETGNKGAVLNPWDLERVAGGSSGGCAAAVAGGEVPIALGSDTGGSIRQPCSFCGVTGIKPTYGAVSRYGLIAYASSLDQIGTIGRDIDDCAALLSLISGHDEKDSTSVLKQAFCFNELPPQKLSNRLDGVKIGLPRNYFDKGIDEEVKTLVLRAAKEFETLGAYVEEFDMPLTEYMIPAYYIIACAEASSNLSRYDGLRYGYRTPPENAETLSEVYGMSRSEGFGLEVRRRIMLGSFVLSSGYYDAYYKKALQTRALIKRAYNRLFEQYDMILSPVAPSAAYKHGENINEPIKMYMGDIYTVSVNLAGLPAVSLPCGFDGAGLPVGFQLVGDAFSEARLIEVARGYEG